MNLFSAILLSITFFFGGDDYKTFLKDGDNYSRNFDIKNAVKMYEKAYALAPNDFETLSKLTKAYNELGEVLIEQNNKSAAENPLNKAVKTAEILQSKYSGNAISYTYLAWSYGNIALFKGGKEKIKYTNKILDNIKKSLKMNPNDAQANLILGILYRELASLSWVERTFANAFLGSVPSGSFQDAEKMMKKALQINPNYINAMFNLSQTYKKMDREQEEIALLNKVLKTQNTMFRDKYVKIKAQKRLAELK